MICMLLAPPHLDALDAALASGACAVVADLTIGPDPVDQRRTVARAWLRAARRQDGCPALYVAPHALASGRLDGDLDALAPEVPDGIVLRGCGSGEEVQRLGAKLAVREAENDIVDGHIGIVPMVASTASDVLALATYAQASPRLRGLAWDPGALAVDLDLPVESAEAPCLGHARSMTIFAARAAGVPALEVLPGIADARLAEALARHRREGLRGVVTRDAAQVPAVLAAYGTQTAAVRIR